MNSCLLDKGHYSVIGDKKQTILLAQDGQGRGQFMSILIRDGKLFETLGNVSLLGRNSFDRYNIKDRCDFNGNLK
ncbi:hypothetical protein COO03_01645 [Bacillus sp. AFS098217]|nr:hypothetical protein COO03_01645 [Bacillus sp. AFS098217]